MQTDYIFQFRLVWAAFPRLVDGALLTLGLSVAVMCIGLLIGIACALGRSSPSRWLQWPVAAYVETIRNTPFLIQLFFVYFGLPSIGIQLDPIEAALIGMSVNCGAYTTEIVRAGIDAIPRGQIEAGRALGFGVPSIVRHIIMFPALRAVFPALASQFILMMLGSLSEGLGLGFHVNGFFPAFVGALIVTVVSFALSMVVKPGSDRKK